MPREATGTIYEKRGDWYVSLTVSSRKGEQPRHSAKLETCKNREDALARRDVIAGAVARLRKVRTSRDAIVTIVDDMAASSAARLSGVLKVVEEMCASLQPDADLDVLTFAELANKWTSGELHRDHPGHVRDVDHAENKRRLTKHVFPFVGETPVTMFSLAHAELVMRQPTLPAGSRRHVAQLITRVMNLAVYPVKAIKVSPIPKGWLPKPNTKKAGSFLYPDEDAALMACTTVPLRTRILFGFLDREGLRKSEAAALEWSDLDLDRGTLSLDENKTDDPRMWRLDPGVARVLAWWKKQREAVTPFVFGDDDGSKMNVEHLADELRAALKVAKVNRPALFESSAARMPLRAHDLRATFVTLSLAAGKSETWVADRTGHRSSQMIQGYRRAARTAAELEVGELLSLDSALPETSAIVGSQGSGGGEPQKPRVRREGVEPSSLAAPEPKADLKRAVGSETLHSSDVLASARATWPLFADAADASPTIRRLRRTRVGRALDDAVRAALAGDQDGMRRTMFRFGIVAGGGRS